MGFRGGSCLLDRVLVSRLGAVFEFEAEFEFVLLFEFDSDLAELVLVFLGET